LTLGAGHVDVDPVSRIVGEEIEFNGRSRVSNCTELIQL
jgi:hypothetical protein